MIDARRLTREHRTVTRRFFLRSGSAGLAALASAGWLAGDSHNVALAAFDPPAELPPAKALEQAIAALGYLTPDGKFRNVERGDPLPSELSDEQRAAVGLTRDTWQLEVVAEDGAKIRHPMTKEKNTALDFAQLMQLAEKSAVRYLKVMTCNNIDDPLGMGLWEGVPLREIVALARPADLVRRVYYYGYHNDKPEQMFRSSLSLGRVLEDPPGEMPVIACYKLNGDWLTPKRGGPVRIVVPEAYGFKSVKWIQRLVLSGDFRANDTYAEANNDVESPHKTFARFLHHPENALAGQPIAITGLAHVGMSGLSKVQYAVDPADRELPPDDPHFTRLDWHDAEVLPPPKHWGAELGENPLPEVPLQFADDRPHQWPLRHTIAHWAALVPGVPAGKYTLRCRTIDARGTAQPQPRPMLRSGHNAIQGVALEVV